MFIINPPFFFFSNLISSKLSSFISSPFYFTKSEYCI
nr:MAG TPA: hypothetical protein [Caudoviricetes sp.]